MIIFVLLLILAAFLQTSFLPLNLVLILIICHSFVAQERTDYYIAFISGIFLGILNSENIGFWAIVFLLVVSLVHTTKKLPFSNHTIIILPVALVAILLSDGAEMLAFHHSLTFAKVLIETLISFPLYLFISFWQERYLVKPELKLKIKHR